MRGEIGSNRQLVTNCIYVCFESAKSNHKRCVQKSGLRLILSSVLSKLQEPLRFF